ncbi:D-glycerate dehydrogenase [Skermanella mucosa]|uniref:2-hydroxyacid dehydrogenase n=1 Tax=Skermanella mucosa TaxID=1789672 RepID=UPI00192A7E31|nr:D-glycerate dehydrogenase [Skermanella mucosa]UEM22461.1 D-glycerate dehydrogenase [Skermanella mucosa]
MNAPNGTTKPVLLLTRRYPDAVMARAARDYRVLVNDDDHPYGADELVRLADGADALLVCAVDPVPAALVRALPDSVRMIATFSVGTDHIDLAAAKARGIVVANTPGVLTDATADIAFLLLLGAARRAAEGERMIREGRWDGWAPTQLIGTHVTGKRLAILGMGRIGQAMARRARGFDMEIHYHNRRRLPAAEEAGAVYHADADEMLSVADFLSIHSPATPETRHWLNADRIARLPDGAVVVNTARGTLVDDEALIAALRSGKLAAAGLDVFENEPKLHPGYAALPNTFLLPHMGSATDRTRDAMGFTALDNLDAFFAGREPPNRVA